MSTVVTVTAENWEDEVLKSDVPVVVDLWAPWCGPCRQIAPILEELSTKYDGKVKVAKVNVDEQPQISAAFEVQSIPTLGVVYQGGLVGKVVGFGGRAHVENVFEQVAKIPETIAAAEKDEAAKPGEEPPANG